MYLKRRPKTMSTRKPRINVILEKPLYEAIKTIAKKEGISVSFKARELLLEALEIHKDRILESIASRREKTFKHLTVEMPFTIIGYGTNKNILI
jgi:predicted DNA-binding ribbon-helix-helix protein